MEQRIFQVSNQKLFILPRMPPSLIITVKWEKIASVFHGGKKYLLGWMDVWIYFITTAKHR